MDFGSVLTALIIISVLGILVGAFLGLAGIVFSVKTNPKEEEVLKALPGNNCGGCGYPGCAGLAKAIVSNEAPVNQCPVGGDEVASEIAMIMGTEKVETEKKVAFVACKAHCSDVTYDYEYYGVEDCRMLSFVPNGGPKSCNEGCLGFGSCVKACQFGAISVVDGVAVVDREKCKACGKCVAVCPKHLISLIPYKSQFAVACSNTKKGGVAAKQCKVGCVGCGICEKNCPQDAIKVKDFNATIDTDKCINCGLCQEKCPKKVIEILK